MNILIVEDETLIRQSLKKILESKGHNVETSSNGTDAINLILNNSFDRIICDIMLQDITGFQVIEESKKKYESNEISSKFVIITAYTSKHILDQASNYGCNVLSKPFDDLNHAIEVFTKMG